MTRTAEQVIVHDMVGSKSKIALVDQSGIVPHFAVVDPLAQVLWDRYPCKTMCNV